MPLGMIQKLLDDKWIWIIFHHGRDENRVMMPGKDLDINSGALWKAVFANNSADCIYSPHRSAWPGHQGLQTMGFNSQFQSIEASPWKSCWGGFYRKLPPFTVRYWGKFGRYQVQTDWKWLMASTPASTERWQKIWKSILNDWGSIKQRLLGNTDHLETSAENDRLNLSATETKLRICNLMLKRLRY